MVSKFCLQSFHLCRYNEDGSEEDGPDPAVARASSAAATGGLGVGGPAMAEVMAGSMRSAARRGAAARGDGLRGGDLDEDSFLPPDPKTLTWVGEIVGVRGGRVRVAWWGSAR
jgi:hypothetical protein